MSLVKGNFIVFKDLPVIDSGNQWWRTVRAFFDGSKHAGNSVPFHVKFSAVSGLILGCIVDIFV